MFVVELSLGFPVALFRFGSAPSGSFPQLCLGSVCRSSSSFPLSHQPSSDLVTDQLADVGGTACPCSPVPPGALRGLLCYFPTLETLAVPRLVPWWGFLPHACLCPQPSMADAWRFQDGFLLTFFPHFQGTASFHCGETPHI